MTIIAVMKIKDDEELGRNDLHNGYEDTIYNKRIHPDAFFGLNSSN